MKRKVVHPEPSERALSGPRYWRSLDELAATPDFKAAVEREFPEGASGMNEVDRRQFMKDVYKRQTFLGLSQEVCTWQMMPLG